MPRSPKDNQEIRDARREEILSAATRVFAQKGFAHTKISDIAREAGLSHGLVYHYFESKEAVFGAIVDSMMSRVDEDLEVPGETPLEKLSRSLDCTIERSNAEPDPGRLVSQAMLLGGVPDEIQQRLRKHVMRIHQRVVGLIRDAQRAGEIADDADPEQLASGLVCMVRGMSIRMPGFAHPPFPLPEKDTILRLLRPLAGVRDESAGDRGTGDRGTGARGTGARGTAARGKAARTVLARAKTAKTAKKKALKRPRGRHVETARRR